MWAGFASATGVTKLSFSMLYHEITLQITTIGEILVSIIAYPVVLSLLQQNVFRNS